jgi:hypothetical protein
LAKLFDIDTEKLIADNNELVEHLEESALWGDIRRAAKTNPALQEALDRAKIIYTLSKPL